MLQTAHVPKKSDERGNVYEFPVFDDKGFFVSIHPLEKSEMKSIRKKATKLGWDKISHRRTTEPDDDKLDELLNVSVIVGWKGLTVDILDELMPLDDKAKFIQDILEGDENREIPHTHEDAQILMDNSTLFTSFVNRYASDLKEARQAQRELETKNS